MHISDICAHALELASMIPVFPCHNEPDNPELDKSPRVLWKTWATTDPVRIKRWWSHPGHADDLIAVPTGAAFGLLLLDIDNKNPDPELRGDKWLLENFDRLPDTRTHTTPRHNGYHLIFGYVAGIGNSTGAIAPGVDTRGQGGLFIWWPPHGGEVLRAMALDALPPWPEWVKIPEPPPYKAHGEGQIVASRQRIERQVELVSASIPDANRNSNLFTAACRIAEMWFRRDDDRDHAFEQLIAPAMHLGLERKECERTIRSAIERVARDAEGDVQ